MFISFIYSKTLILSIINLNTIFVLEYYINIANYIDTLNASSSMHFDEFFQKLFKQFILKDFVIIKKGEIVDSIIDFDDKQNG